MKTTIQKFSLTALLATVALTMNAADLYVPTDYTTIQAAVDAASNGDTIHIAPGVYVEQVTITNKDLTLIGQPGAILRAYAGMPQSLAAYGSVSSSLLGIALSHVVVSGLTLEGERLADSQPDNYMVGIYFLGASGRVEDCRVMGFRGSTLGAADAAGILVLNSVILGTEVVDAQVLRSTFADNLVSIDMVGDFPLDQPTADPTLLRTIFTINNNTILGSGPDSTDAQYGIWIEHGAGGEVKWNTISDYSYTGTTPGPWHGALAAFGIVANDSYDFALGTPLAVLQPVRYEGNVFRNNQWHFIVLRADGSSLVNNSFEGTAAGVRHVGVAFSGDNVVVSSNRFNDIPQGILLFGDNDPWLDMYGLPPQYFGVASNATLVANGFCNVATNIVAEPPATYTEQGTLTCPEPALDISRAVLLSWPYSYDGYSVESGPTPNGPWTTNSDVTVFLQEGQNSVAIPMNTNQQYFKLVKP